MKSAIRDIEDPVAWRLLTNIDFNAQHTTSEARPKLIALSFGGCGSNRDCQIVSWISSMLRFSGALRTTCTLADRSIEFWSRPTFTAASACTGSQIMHASHSRRSTKHRRININPQNYMPERCYSDRASNTSLQWIHEITITISVHSRNLGPRCHLA